MSNGVGAISLEKSVRTCDVNTGEAPRIQSDRFLNPNNMVCIPWNNINSKGQVVHADSFYTKTPGCNSAEDRVAVENFLRPNYMSYVTLNAQGIAGNMYGNTSAFSQSLARDDFDMSRNQVTGNFGHQWSANVDYTGCSVGAYERAQAQMAQAMRNQSFMQNGGTSEMYKNASGF